MASEDELEDIRDAPAEDLRDIDDRDPEDPPAPTDPGAENTADRIDNKVRKAKARSRARSKRRELEGRRRRRRVSKAIPETAKSAARTAVDAGKTAASAAAGAADRPDWRGGDRDEVREMARNAEQSGAVSPPVDATLQPTSNFNQVGDLARAGPVTPPGGRESSGDPMLSIDGMAQESARMDESGGFGLEFGGESGDMGLNIEGSDAGLDFDGGLFDGGGLINVDE